MIAEIITTKKLPKTLSVLSYKIPKKLQHKIKIGQLLNIPLRNSITTGIVYRIKKSKKTFYPLKNIINLINPKPIFTPRQLKLFADLADYYYVSTSLFVHFNLPKLIKKDWAKLSQSRQPAQPIRHTRPIEPTYFWWHTLDERSKFYLKQIQSAKKNKSQILIIVPRINDIFDLAKKLKLKSTDYTPIHRKLPRAENFSTWLKVVSRKSLVAIGTRSSLFYPFTNIKTIIIDDEHSLDHKQSDMNPRYETKIVAEKISQIYKTKIIYSSPSPSLTSYYQLGLKYPLSPIRPVSTVNLKNELTKKNYSFISDELYVQIKSTLARKKNIFLFINKKGESSNTTCCDCGFTFNCPTCALPLIKTKKNKLICYHCNYSEDLPPFCPKCTGPDFKSTGLGIQKIETNLRKLFPQDNIVRIDNEQNEKSSARPPGLRPCEVGQVVSRSLPKAGVSSVVIGTEFALDKIQWTKIGLLGIINADNLWQHSEFTASESAYHLLIKLLTLATKNANIVIQTFVPNHYIIKSIIQNKPKIFYQQELKFRKQFDYPPFINLIKLSYLNKSEKLAEKETQKLYQKLTKINKNIIINPPIQILRRKIRGKYKYNIILKLENLNEFKSLIKHIPNNWLIDIQPRTLLS